jgi:diguanylate cyclase (GGDEF)-like protein/PAS domain S-box-containing protein
MIPSILYFSPQLASWKAQLNTKLQTHGHTVEWLPIQQIKQSPALSLVLIAENDISAEDILLIPSRKTIVIVDEWSLEVSAKWINRGADNCFAHHDEHLISWLLSEFSKFALTRTRKTDDDVLQVIIDAIPAPIFFKDQRHIYRGCNTAFCEFIGRPRDEVVGHSVYDIAPKHLADIYYEADCELLAKGGTQRYEAEVRFCNGSLHEMEFNKAVFTNAGGQAIGQVGVMLEVTERNELIRKLDKATRTDPLTGMSNRREFNLTIQEALNEQKSSEQKLSLMTLDIDFFKQINDRFGHGGGDRTLQLIASWLQSQLHETDHAFRVGGEEFYILMRGKSIKSALGMAESLCKHMATTPFMINHKSIYITFSAGVIELTPNLPLDDALEMVDKALYEAKSNGRNCVCHVFQ